MKARLALLAAVLWATRASAQQVSGVVRDSILASPVAGAVVSLADSTGKMLSRGITNEHGEYHIAAAAQGRTLRVIRIGYHPATVPWSPSEKTHDFVLATVPPLLEPVTVRASSNCPRRDDAAAALSLLQQARAGLLTTIVARDAKPASILRLLYERKMDGNSERIVEQTVRRDFTDNATRSFIALRSGKGFVDSGFVVRSDGGMLYLGPDAEVLMDDAFANGYCFRLADPARDRRAQIGLSFAPATRKKGRVDIEGTLWIDSVAKALRTIDYVYVGVDEPNGAIRPNGFTSFHDMPNGVVFVDQWRIRMFNSRLDTLGSGRDQYASVSYFTQESGGEVAAARWPDGAAWESKLGTLRATLIDRAGKPVTRAFVKLDGTDYDDSTDAKGMVELQHVLPGPYTLVYADSELARLNITLPAMDRFTATRGDQIARQLSVPRLSDFVRHDCLRPPPPSPYGLASSGSVGVVKTDPDTTSTVSIHAMTKDARPVLNANVEISYDAKQNNQAATQRGFTNAQGLWQSCLVFHQHDKFIAKVWREGEEAIVVHKTADWGQTIVDVRLPDPPRP